MEVADDIDDAPGHNQCQYLQAIAGECALSTHYRRRALSIACCL
jgi:hypothetical protein